jgi:ABC-type transport system involved in cytochrome bd biosynthesis fused ATPase/permease subunit
MLVYFSIVVLIDHLMVNSFKGTDGTPQTLERNQLAEDLDVLEQKNATIAAWDNNEYPIKSKDLKKVYKNGVAAVNLNTFSVKKGEVFGLLGPNGAGKSSMFNIMTMNLKRSGGDVKILGKDLDSIKVGEDGNKMGMCP